MGTRASVSGVWCLTAALFLCRAGAGDVRAQALPVLSEADRLEVSRYQLGDGVLGRIIDVNTQLLTKVTSDRTLREALLAQSRSPAPATLDEAVRRCERETAVAALLAHAGLRPREYLVAQLAMIQAVAALENVRAGLAKAPRPGSGALASNMAFIEAHPDRARLFETVFDELAAVLDGGSRR